MGDSWRQARKNFMANTRPVGEAQRLIGDLRAEGWTCTRIASESGLSTTTLTKIMHGRVGRVSSASYDALSRLSDPDRLPLRDRFDPEPLICAISVLGIGSFNADRADDKWLEKAIDRWRATGLLWWQADEWAARLGLHPADKLLWGDDWWVPEAVG